MRSRLPGDRSERDDGEQRDARDEKRVYPRCDVRLHVECETTGVLISTQATNIAAGGLFVRTSHPFPLGSEITLVLGLPEPFATIRARGTVIWAYDASKKGARALPGMGIRFVEMSEK